MLLWFNTSVFSPVRAVAPETWRNSNIEALAFFGTYWYGPYGTTVWLQDHLQQQEGGFGASDGPFSFAAGFTMSCLFTL